MTRPIIKTIAITLAASLSMLPFLETTTMAQTQPRTPAPAQAPTAAPNSTLPNGATSLNETYQDWVVLCGATEGGGRACVMTQQQHKQDTGQLVLAAEFTRVTKDSATGSLVLPFGLKLSEGVTLQVDDGPVSKPLPFATCLPAGCIVQLSFDAAAVKALRSGTVAKLVAKAHDSGQNVQLGISLKGFASAHDRVLALATQ
jgi:invasion protein IalB